MTIRELYFACSNIEPTTVFIVGCIREGKPGLHILSRDTVANLGDLRNREISCFSIDGGEVLVTLF